jgi:hypothetical protein
MTFENEPLYIDLREFASNHSIDLLVSPYNDFGDNTMYVAVLYDNEKVANVTFRKNSELEKRGFNAGLNIAWTVGWYTGMVKVNEHEKATMKYESGNETDISNFYDILLNKSIPGIKKMGIDLKKNEIRETAEEWSLE